MRAAILIGWALGMGFVTAGIAQVPEVTIKYSEPLQNIRISQQNLETTLKKSTKQTGTPLSFVFNAYGRHFDLDLDDNTSLHSLAKNAASSGDFRLLKGRLRSNPKSWARLTIVDGAIMGMINDMENVYVIEPDPKTEEMMIYRMADIELSGLGCGNNDYETLFHELKNETLAKTPVATREIEVSTLAGSLYRTNWGSRAIPDMLASFNAVDGIFSEQLGIQIQVVESNETMRPVTDGRQSLENLAALRFSKPGLRRTGLTHLYTAVNLNVTDEGETKDIVGIAYLDVLCNDNWGVGITEVGNRFVQDALVTAHEIGHNFSAVHDGKAPCSNVNSSGFLMAANYNGFPEFSQCSVDQMQTAMATGGCLRSLSRIDVQVTSSLRSIQALLGQDFRHSYEIRNRGSAIARNVGVEITSSSSLSIQTAEPSTGSCTTIAEGISCQLGELPIGASRLLNLTSQANNIGDLQMIATARTLGDVAAGNDQFATGVFVRPAVNLGLSFSNVGTQLALEDSIDTVLTVSNDNTFVATNLSVDFSIPSGLGVQSISTQMGNCSIAGVQVRCETSILEKQNQFDIALSVSGRIEGVHTIQANVVSAEADTDTNDNSATINLTVGNPSSSIENTGRSTGGGGSLLWSLLLLLPCLIVRSPIRPQYSSVYSRTSLRIVRETHLTHQSTYRRSATRR